ncbi:MAG: transposase [Spirosomataceae bacterium]
MNKLPVYISENDFGEYILPHLSHKLNHNRLKVSYHFIFNTILYVLKSGCSWRTLKPDNQLVTWQNIYYHYAKWSSDGSFEKLFSSTHQIMKASLALECIQLDGSHTPSKKGDKKLNTKNAKSTKRPII